MANFIPHTQEERKEMLEKIGINDLSELFSSVPKEMIVDKLNLPKGKSELEVRRKIEGIAKKNKNFKTIFRGALSYNHYIPSIVKSVTSKEEFLTAYTPYQPEISQGVLQSIFEYQTMICSLTGLDVSNASVYDGATAAAEAIAMTKERKRVKAFVCSTINPMVMQTIKTYCFGSDTELVIVPEKDGKTDLSALESMLTADSACLYMQQPNFYGIIEDATKIGEIVHSKGAKFIMGVNPIFCAAYKTPAECGADIAVGEGQPLGLPMSFGGPYLGFMTAKTDMMRKLPGRIVGETTDVDGKRAFVLTLQAREQHIRREKASSNICSNEALCALTAGAYMSAMGPAGMREVALQCTAKAAYAAKAISSVKGFELKYDGPFFNEFVTHCPCDGNIIMAELEKHCILGGLPIGNEILWCVTEMNTKEEIDTLVNILKEVTA